MKLFLKIITLIIFLMLCIGFYFQYIEKPFADKIIGIAVLMIILILLPVFLYARLRNKNMKDYLLTDEKWKEMKENLKK